MTMKIKERIIKFFAEFKRQEKLLGKRKKEKTVSTKLCCVRSSVIPKRKTLCKEGHLLYYFIYFITITSSNLRLGSAFELT